MKPTFLYKPFMTVALKLQKYLFKNVDGIIRYSVCYGIILGK